MIVTICRKGVGMGLNIDQTRVPYRDQTDLDKLNQMVSRIKQQGSFGDKTKSWKNSSDLSLSNDPHEAGRWGPNVLFCHKSGLEAHYYFHTFELVDFS